MQQNRIFASAARVVLVLALVGCLLPATFVDAASTRTPRGPNAIQADNVDGTILYPRANYTWEYSLGPIYDGVDELRARGDDPTVLRLDVGSFDLSFGTPGFPPELTNQVAVSALGAQYFVMTAQPRREGMRQFLELRDQLVAAGGAVVQELGGTNFIVRANAAAYGVLQGHPEVRALEPYHAAFKLSPNIGRAPLQDPAKALADVYTLDVQLFAGENAAAAAKAIRELGGNVLSVTTDVIQAELHRTQLGALAKLEPVRKVFEVLPINPHASETTAVMQVGTWQLSAPASYIYHQERINGGGFTGTCTVSGLICQGIQDCPSPQTCTGSGSPQILMALDTGIQLDGGDLSDTRTSAGVAGAAHRKVLRYESAVQFSGGGDLLGCDAASTNGVTHGHVVAATALGNATNVPVRYGLGWQKLDPNNNAWPVDGVAPRAILVAYDAQATPITGNCNDPALTGGLLPGTIYDGIGVLSSLEVAYATHGARTFNFSWGTTNNATYSTNAQRIDNFLNDRSDAMVFVSAGNDGKDVPADGVPDENSISDPATTKNAIVVGASGNTSIPFNNANEEDRFQAGNVSGSSVGPATAASQRVAPLLMAPGTDFGAIGGNMGFDSEFACLTVDNNQANPVECDLVQSRDGTSFSSPAAAGAAMLSRDYFAQGFYPDGTASNPGNAGDRTANISGALVKALLVASADWMDNSTTVFQTNISGGNLTKDYRFNFEQGYGRIQLSNVLPLQSSALTPVGLIVSDGAQAGSRVDITGIDGAINVATAQTDTGSFTVCDANEELRVALVWIDATGESLINNLDLELCPPSNPGCTVPGSTNITSKIYYGNYFTDDNDRNNNTGPTEDCNHTFLTGSTTNFDVSPWTLPTCSNTPRDTRNPVEAIYLSPDAKLDGTGVGFDADKQTEAGTWTIKVKGVTGPATNQKYAVVVTGGVCAGSSVQFNDSSYVCNDAATVVVNERDEIVDPAGGLTVGEVQSRTTVQVVHPGPDNVHGTGDDVVVDTETPTFGAPTGLKFTSASIPITDGTVADPGNGLLDARSGELIRVIYADETSGATDNNKRRSNTAAIACQSNVFIGGAVFGQFGMDTTFLVNGGCERDGRNLFTFGFPDRYMDSGERVGFSVAFQSSENEDLTDVQVSLRCVIADADSPADCLPGSTQCADSNRLNNASCGAAVQILDSPKQIGLLPAGQVGQPSFTVQLGSISGNPKVEFLAGVSAKKSGRTTETLLVTRTTLNSDEQSFFYSTDYPDGGATAGLPPYPEIRDYINDEVTQNPTTNPGDFEKDYRFESIAWSSLHLTGRNTSLTAPWNFEGSKQGWSVGRNNTSTVLVGETVANWGEDFNFNGILDYYCTANKAIACPGPSGNCGRCSNNSAIICVPPDNTPCVAGTCNADALLGLCTSDEDRDPINNALDDNWGMAGGCGWQTNGDLANGTIPGGMWHTGKIQTENVGNCLFSGTNPGGSCQNYETLSGTARTKRIWEVLLSPTMEKVNQCDPPTPPGSCGAALDAPNDPVFTVEFIDWAWNMAMDLKDEFAQLRWEFDTDTTTTAPIDLINDAVVLNALGGAQGTVSEGNSPLTDGFQVFAPFSAPVLGNSLNGSVGNNRVGSNPCYFEQSPRFTPFHLAEPRDDDLDNDTDGLTDEFVRPNGPIRNFNMQEVNGPDMRFGTFEDIYGPSGESFQAGLGFRVFEGDTDVSAATSYGAGVDDMVVQWREYKLVEDTTNCVTSGACASIVVDSDNIFDGNGLAIIRILDSSPYGMTVPVNDCNRDGDFTDDGAPPGPGGADDDNDCDNNGITDVTFIASTIPEPAGELFVANLVSSGVYQTSVPISATANAPGVLFVQDGGANNPEVTIRYEDRWDGTASGAKCLNDSNPVTQGFIEEGLDVVVVRGGVTIISFRLLETNGDLDGYPDTNETFQLFATVQNKTTLPLTNVVVQASSSDPKIDCVLSSTSLIPSMDARGGPTAIQEIPTPFVLHVNPNADRGGTAPAVACNAGVCSNGAPIVCATAINCVRSVNNEYSARINITIATDQFDVNIQPQAIVLDLDLNSTSPVGATSVLVEGFEPGFGNFTFMNLDTNVASNSATNGARCQYNDPDYPNSNSYGDTECYLGFVAGQVPPNNWHPHTVAGSPDNGRAFLGSTSMHYGIHPSSDPAEDTYRLSQLDALRSFNAINLAARVCQNDPATLAKRSCNAAADCVVVGGGPCVSASPQLSIKHQVSTLDSRFSNTPAGQAADRAVVQAQINGALFYTNLTPFENVYDVQGTDNFSNCTFDPTDDGNTEDTYFDPSDPARRLGPASTCYPEFTFSCLGNTNLPFSPSQICRADVGPGLQGSLGIGTWVESKFDLSRYRGRAVRMRFLFTTIKVSDTSTPTPIFMLMAGDDGWYIDDIRTSQTLGTSSSTVALDSTNNAALAACPAAACTSLTAALSTTPNTGATPGQFVTLSAAASSVDRCANGSLLYRFYIDTNPGGGFNAGDTLLRDFGTGSIFSDAPVADTPYAVTVKCSQGGTGLCTGGDVTAPYDLTCTPPPPAYDAALWWAQVKFSSKTTLALPPFGEVTDVVKGDLITLRSSGTFSGSSPTCFANNNGAYTVTDNTNPATGAGFYYLLRGQQTCNDSTSYRTFAQRDPHPPGGGLVDAEGPSPTLRDTLNAVCAP